MDVVVAIREESPWEEDEWPDHEIICVALTEEDAKIACQQDHERRGRGAGRRSDKLEWQSQHAHGHSHTSYSLQTWEVTQNLRGRKK